MTILRISPDAKIGLSGGAAPASGTPADPASGTPAHTPAVGQRGWQKLGSLNVS
jgi:hypothetical protein